MAGIGSQLGGGSATLERQSLDLTQQVFDTQAKTDDGGTGGNNGKSINNGGGGDGGGGDDDDYFDDFDEEEGDDNVFSRRRTMIPELFDRVTIEAVLQEWYKTIYSLPSGIRMAVEMGLVSSAQLVNFLSVDARPSVIRSVARQFPSSVSRGFIGRLMGDPSILAKLAFEQTLAASLTVWYEAQQRGKRFKNELDLVAVNVASVMATNAAMVWLCCPNRVFGAPTKFPWQRALSQLPSNAFDRSGPLRQYSYASRATGFLFKAAQLSLIGSGVGLFSGAAQNMLIAARGSGFVPVLKSPSVPTSVAGYGAYAGLTGNARYQLLNGLDRYMLQNFNSLPLTLGVSALVRVGGQELGEHTRRHWLGLPKEAPKRFKNATIVKKTIRRVKKVKSTPVSALSPSRSSESIEEPAQSQGFSVSASVGKRTHH
eukprot:CAMPEP_0196576612 /NCGR_PEP_ID=MMETSP1081-20130531/5816_1 /TAXON_ID=36882 /ORGANISM="Pyramimonas amylifera, Strain CCMP720" /LENGTH=426 /DNA_ID=CAMNT_0041895263 /DNA_START=453 /DNA_END=1733 /DNA_ORIENTATION=+